MAAFKSIVISGLPAVGKSALKEKLVKELGMEALSIGGMWREKWKTEHPDGEPAFDKYWKSIGITENRRMDERTRSRVEKEGLIADLRYTYGYGETSLKVFLTAPLNARIAHSIEREEYLDKDVDHVTYSLIRREEDEVYVGRRLYGIDYRDPLQYNLILNTATLTLEEEARIVTNLFRLRRD